MRLLPFIVISAFLFLTSCTKVYYVFTGPEPIWIYNSNASDSKKTVVIEKGEEFIGGKYNRKTYTRPVNYKNNIGYIYYTGVTRKRRYRGNFTTPVSHAYRSSGIGNYNTSTYSSRPKTVRVKGYYRKNGTYVRPHTRSAPRRN